MEEAEFIRLVLYNELEKLNGEFRRGLVIVEFITGWSLARLMEGGPFVWFGSDRFGKTVSD